MPVTWEVPPSEAFQAMTLRYGSLIHQAILHIANVRAVEIESWMKSNAAWQDRTGEARKQLITDIIDLADSAIVIILSHGVDYGVFLELSYGGRYAIITPALDEFIPKIWSDVVRVLGV